MSQWTLTASKYKSLVNFVYPWDLHEDSGRDDWLWVDNNGAVTTYANQRGVSKSLRPNWVKSGDPNDDKDEGITHPGMGKDVGRDKISFGRIYGSGRADVSSNTQV